jgi:hypothetical protein
VADGTMSSGARKNGTRGVSGGRPKASRSACELTAAAAVSAASCSRLVLPPSTTASAATPYTPVTWCQMITGRHAQARRVEWAIIGPERDTQVRVRGWACFVIWTLGVLGAALSAVHPVVLLYTHTTHTHTQPGSGTCCQQGSAKPPCRFTGRAPQLLQGERRCGYTPPRLRWR